MGIRFKILVNKNLGQGQKERSLDSLKVGATPHAYIVTSQKRSSIFTFNSDCLLFKKTQSWLQNQRPVTVVDKVILVVGCVWNCGITHRKEVCQTPKLCPSVPAQKNEVAKAARINFLGTLECNKKLITTRGMPNEGKRQLSVAVRELCGIYLTC